MTGYELFYVHADFFTRVKNAQVVTSCAKAVDKMCSHALFFVCCNKFGSKPLEPGSHLVLSVVAKSSTTM